MTEQNKSFVILGGGSAGLSTAVKLIDGGHRNVIVVEAKPDVGGLASSFNYRDYKLDYGPHAFHSKADEADEMFTRFCPKGYEKILMQACLLFKGKYFNYPLKFAQAIFRLPVGFTAKMIYDYGVAQFKRLVMKIPEDSFEAWGVKRYGRTMYDMAFGNYSEKVWGMSTSQLHWKMAAQKLPDLNFFELIREALGGKGAKQKILYSSYFYPRGGIGDVFASMENYIIENGGRILKETQPVEIIQNNTGEIETIILQRKNGRETIPCSFLVSTIPIPDIVNAMRPSPSPEVLSHANNLVYRNLVLVMMEVAAQNVTNQIMVYLLDKEFTFNRIGEQKNVDASMIPPGKTVLCFEICTDESSELWARPDEYFFELAKQDVLKLGTVPEEKITGYFIRRLKHVYPIYDLTFDVNLEGALEYLLSIPNLISLGRQGLFIHNDIHDSMKMGIDGAKFILSGAPKDAWRKTVRDLLNWRLK